MARWFPRENPEHARMPTVVMPWITMKKYACSTICMVEEFAARRGRRPGTVHVPSKLCMHKWVDHIPLGAPDFLPAFTAGRGAFGTISGDSAHCRLSRYGMAYGARRGPIHQKMAIRQHAPISPIQKVVATDGRTADSPGPSQAVRQNTIRDMHIGGLLLQ